MVARGRALLPALSAGLAGIGAIAWLGQGEPAPAKPAEAPRAVRVAPGLEPERVSVRAPGSALATASVPAAVPVPEEGSQASPYEEASVSAPDPVLEAFTARGELVTESAVHLARGARRQLVRGSVSIDGPFLVEVYAPRGTEPPREPVERILFREGGGTFTLRLNPGRWLLQARDPAGRTTPLVAVSVGPRSGAEVALSPVR